MAVALELDGVAKTFTLHLHGGTKLPVLRDVSFVVARGESLVLTGPSGCGKSSVLKMIFGTYRCDAGRILVREADDVFDVAAADPREILRLRARNLGYVSQFLRVIPRLATIDVVAEPLVATGTDRDVARARAAGLLARLNVPERLWSLSPVSFSGGEQQRVNIARALLPERPILLLDEPTAALDETSRSIVADLIKEAKRRGAAVVSVVHDQEVRALIADKIVDVMRFCAVRS
jgi:alpha-D-ribose 1-methylphosphonate 5-triphosphate synthase subunit PhnL